MQYKHRYPRQTGKLHKLMKHNQRESSTKNTARLNVIHKDMWIRHYKELWTEGNGKGKNDDE